MNQFEPPVPDLQITFHKRLQELRTVYLLDALQSVVAESDVRRIDRELSDFVSKRALRQLARWSLRGEILFPVPCILIQSPQLLGYYRLLLGFSQKQFYGSRYGIASFRSMEVGNRLTSANARALPDLCKTLCQSSELLIEGIGMLSAASVHDLNRIGEAEKSHQKAKKRGYVECWTMVGVAKLDVDKVKKESPTTDSFFLIDAVCNPKSEQYKDFREAIRSLVGIRD